MLMSVPFQPKADENERRGNYLSSRESDPPTVVTVFAKRYSGVIRIVIGQIPRQPSLPRGCHTDCDRFSHFGHLFSNGNRCASRAPSGILHGSQLSGISDGLRIGIKGLLFKLTLDMGGIFYNNAPHRIPQNTLEQLYLY